LGCLFLVLVGVAAAAEGGRYVAPPAWLFDLAESRARLEPGPAVLRARIGGPAMGDSTVALYPCTDYFQEYLDLRARLDSEPHRSATIDDRARRCRLVSEVSDGRFEFAGLKPGRYYVESPAMSLYGDSPAVDQIFADGGCVYFQASRGAVIEIPDRAGVLEIDLELR
jgi:hypothetical protein